MRTALSVNTVGMSSIDDGRSGLARSRSCGLPEPGLVAGTHDSLSLRIEERVEHRAELRHDVAAFGLRFGFEQIDTDDRLRIRGVDQHDVVQPVRRYPSEDVLHEVTVRVEDGDARPVGDVLQGEVEQHGALAGTGLPGDVHVSEAVRFVEQDGVVPVVSDMSDPIARRGQFGERCCQSRQIE